MIRVAPLVFLFFVQEPDVDILLDQLSDPSVEVREKAIAALVDLDLKAKSKVRARMESAVGEVRLLCKKILDEMDTPKQLRGVLPPIPRVTIDAKDREIREVLKDFQRQTRMPLSLKNCHDGPITVRFREASPLEALDATCRSARLVWFFPHLGSRHWGFEEPPDPDMPVHHAPPIYLTAGAPPDIRRVFFRHYVVELPVRQVFRTVDSRHQKQTGRLYVGLWWPAGVRPYSAIIELTSVTNDQGNEVLIGRENTGVFPSPRGRFLLEWNPLRFCEGFLFRISDQGSRTLASVRGRARVFYLKSEKFVTFDSPESAIGTRKEIDGLSVELTDYKASELHLFCMARARVTGRTLYEWPRLRAQLAGVEAASVNWAKPVDDSGNHFEFVIGNVRSRILSIEVVAESECVEDAFEFEFRDIPIPE